MIRQRLQTDPQFRAAYPRQVAKEMQLEQALEGKLSREGKNRQAKVRGKREEGVREREREGVREVFLRFCS